MCSSDLKFSFFSRRKKETPEIEDDIYYGLQLRSIDDYRKDYNNIVKEKDSAKTDTENKPHFSYLFNEETNVDDEEIAKHFEQLHKERKNKVENIMREHGIDYDEFNSKDTKNTSKKNTGELNNNASEISSKPVLEPAAPKTPQTPEHKPQTEPQPKPEIEPNPVSQPEIRPPITEPVSQPHQPPLTDRKSVV